MGLEKKIFARRKLQTLFDIFDLWKKLSGHKFIFKLIKQKKANFWGP